MDYIILHFPSYQQLQDAVNEKIAKWYLPYWPFMIENNGSPEYIQVMTLAVIQYVTVKPHAITSIWWTVNVSWCSCSCW